MAMQHDNDYNYSGVSDYDNSSINKIISFLLFL